MSYLLDTIAVCEITKRKPHREFMEWLSEIEDRFLFLSVLSIGEIKRGVEMLPPSRKKAKLMHWLDHELTEWFEERILSIDREVAEEWGRLLSRKDRTMSAIDSLLAATASRHNLILVTRNTKDFDYPEIDMINPWD